MRLQCCVVALPVIWYVCGGAGWSARNSGYVGIGRGGFFMDPSGGRLPAPGSGGAATATRGAPPTTDVLTFGAPPVAPPLNAVDTSAGAAARGGKSHARGPRPRRPASGTTTGHAGTAPSDSGVGWGPPPALP
jgi:hypothetical protein